MLSLKWTPTNPDWSGETYQLLLDYKVEKCPTQTTENIIEKSKNFAIKFPVDTVRCELLKNHVTENILERNINSVYPIVHYKALELFCKFILFKRTYGTTVEQQLYKDMTLKGFIERLLKKRAVSFFGVHDIYLLINKERRSGSWESIGKSEEELPLVLKDCLSYDEIKCSAYLYVSSYTYFVNMGDRKNKARFSDDRSNIEDEGIIIGMIGPRLKKPFVMEYEEIISTGKQNTVLNGYGSSVENSLPKLFFDLFEEKCLEYKETMELKESLRSSDERRFHILRNEIFDNYIYYKRLAIAFDTLLFEANYRAKSANKTAYIHVVGLGLGVWQISSHQGKIFLDTFADRIEIFGSQLHSVSDICFSYMNSLKCGNYKHGDVFPIKDHPLGGIKIHMYKREPHAKVSQANEEKLLIVSYAWDGNALPGNEWWLGKLGSSGDSAAASSTQITELHNPHINPLVSADNLRVLTEDGILPLEKYQEVVRCTKSKRERERSV